MRDRLGSTVGFVGLGAMGLPMAANVSRGGHQVLAWSRRGLPETARAAGLSTADTLRVLAERSSVVVTMLPDLPQLEEVLTGREGLAAGFHPDTILVVGSSVSPVALRALAERLTATHSGLRLLDAPVSGGVEGASAGTLAIMVGGDEATFAAARPVLAAMGRPQLVGPLGSGEVAKACNQLIVAATMSAIAEAAVIASRSGLDLGQLLDIFQGGYADSRVLRTKSDRIVSRDYRADGALKYMVKDLRAASDEAGRQGVRSPQLASLTAAYERAVAEGFGDQDLAAIHAWVEAASTSGSREGTSGLLS